MTVRVLKKLQTPRPAHHRRGWMRIGKAVTVWCTCGWKFRGEAKESEVDERWSAHIGPA